jgi:hypothetical protein
VGKLISRSELPKCRRPAWVSIPRSKLPKCRRPEWVSKSRLELPDGSGPAWNVQSRSELPKCRRSAWIVSEVGTTKGWACGVAKKDNDWLGSSTGPHTKEV